MFLFVYAKFSGILSKNIFLIAKNQAMLAIKNMKTDKRYLFISLLLTVNTAVEISYELSGVP